MKNKAEMKKLVNEQKEILENIMAKRDWFYIQLETFEKKHGYIPEKYKSDVRLMNAYAEYQRFKGWKNIPGVMAIINKAAKIAAENIVKHPELKTMTREQKEKYLKQKTEEIFKSVEKAKKILDKKK